MKKLGLYILLLCLSASASAQDLNARVKVISGKIKTTNTHIFQSLETAMKDFLNGHKWSVDNILPNERIDCNFVLNLTNWDGSSNFSGELQVQSSRPVFNSSYTSPLLNINDKDFDFIYAEGSLLTTPTKTFKATSVR